MNHSQQPPNTKISVILVAYHGDKWLPECLNSLEKACHHKIHLVLLDNAGNTIINQLDLSPFDAEVLKCPHPMGFAEANNFALTHASRLESIVVFLNQDTISQPEWVDRCLEHFYGSENLGALSPLIRTYDGAAWDPSFFSCLSSPKKEELMRGIPSRVGWFAVHNAPAACLLVRTDVLKKVGPFDPIYGSYYEDYDLCLRIKKKGFVIGVSESGVVYHFSGSATNTRERELKRMRQVIRNRILFQIRESGNHRLTTALGYVVLDLPRRLLRGIIGTPSSQPPLTTLKAYRDLSRIASRLLSQRRDHNAWQAYLEEIGWINRFA